MRERERFIARIRQIRRAIVTPEEPQQRPTGAVEQDRVGALESRLEHLEQMVQGLQDSVHRESSRHARRIGELEARLEPAALGKALSDDARARGL